MNPPLIEVHHLSVSQPAGPQRPATPVLRDICFEVERGGVLTLVGPSGSGKSTLLRCLNRLSEPSSGTIRLGGEDICRLDPRQLRRRAAMVMQTPVLFEGTVRDNLRLRPAGMACDLGEPRLAAALDEVGLATTLLDRDAAELSGGEKQRVTIARALLGDPEVLLLDEPTSALDASIQQQVLTLLRDAQQRYGVAYLFISHDLAVIRAMAHDVLVLRHGQVVESGPAEQLFAAPQAEYTRALLAAARVG